MPIVSRQLTATSRPLDLLVDIVVCIPSFRRPDHLRKTLQSLADQKIDRRFSVVIVENDAARCESAPVAAEFLQNGALQGICIVEPKQGNCHAINAAFETALVTFSSVKYLLMIDDDEVASLNWLKQMVDTAERTGADVVGGPVFPVFTDESTRPLRRHPAFCPAYEMSGPVPIIYGCGNCLIRRTAFGVLEDPAFDVRFNFLGGGDTDFFTRCRLAGLKFHWQADAVITETVPPVRTKAGWLALRGLRIGAINYHVELKAARTLRLKSRLLARLLARLPLSMFRAARLLLTEGKPIFALHPVAVAFGSMLASLGIEPQPYKASKIVS